MNRILLVIFLTLAISRPAVIYSQCVECDTSKFILSIKPEDSNFLYYGLFQNIFDSCGVSYEIGEFRIVDTTGVETRVYLEFDTSIVNDNSPYVYKSETNPYWGILGCPSQGIDTLLSSVLRTRIFVYPPNSRIRFYRVLQAYRNCDVVKKDTNISYCDDQFPNFNPFFLVEKNNCIVDTSEWVLYLVRASDNQIIAVLDSVGFFPNGSCPYVPVYGTNPLKMNQERVLPNQFANEPVLIKLSVRRYGPSPFGMFFNPTHGRINSSSIREYDATNGCEFGFKCNFKMSWFENYYYHKVIEYLDSISIAKNRPPFMYELPELWFFDNNSNYIDSILGRYFPYDSDNHIYFDTLCREQYNYSSGRFPPWEPSPLGLPSEEKFVIDNIVASSTVNNFELRLKVNETNRVWAEGETLTDCQIKIYNYSGGLIYSKGNVDLKLNTWVTLTIPYKLSRGVYLITIYNTNLPKILSRYFVVK
ncbi:hypothetical protein D9V84_04115 [Bacteroidetes/Chlorobi group bacterium Naka2016]|jgi:hypothetical protein|nr:MAG: hypothetical protein D9V84_04115 [Bacteroidetes/Chlorobi group bacterium Naka2016]